LCIVTHMKQFIELSNIVHMFWHGENLPYFQQCVVRSWINNGWIVNFWSYKTELVPPGVIHRDASKLYPVEDVYSISQGYQKKSIAAFSDLFRYAILSSEQGMWSDMDTFCLRSHMDWESLAKNKKYVCGLESNEKFYVGTGILAFPDINIPSLMLNKCKSIIKEKNKILDEWAIIGPTLVSNTLSSLKIENDAVPVEYFYPVPVDERGEAVDSSKTKKLKRASSYSYAYQFWNSGFTLDEIDKNKKPNNNSFIDFVIESYCF